MKKNKISDIKRILIVGAVSLVIVASGILVPTALLSLKSKPSNLPHGVVDTGNIQPYGADAIRVENSLLAATDRMLTSGFPTGNITSTWVATDNDRFSAIGIQEKLYEQGYSFSPEFVGQLDQEITNYFGSGIGPTILVSSTEETDGEADHPLYRISAQDNTTQIYLDGETGIPVLADIRMISSGMINRAGLRSQIVKLYQEYTGLDFVYSSSDPGSFEDFDSYYLYQIENTDHKILLTIEITSGWYWLPPDSNSEEWTPTNEYEWHISIYCNALYNGDS